MNAQTGLIERHAIRALLLTPDDRLLLMQIRLPRSGHLVWLTPGGGCAEGEAPEQTLRRELFEETGLREFPPGPHVWHREHEFSWDGRRIRQIEDYHLIRIDPFDPLSQHMPAHEVERHLFQQFRWWELAEIEASSDLFVPRSLGVELRRLIERGPPTAPIRVGV